MSAIFRTHVAMACMLALGACAIDSPPNDNHPTAGNPTTGIPAGSDDKLAGSDDASLDTPGFATIPEEPSFENLSDVTITGDEAATNACHVKLMYCKDSQHHYKPSYCTYGHCLHNEEYKMAKSMCYDKCKHTDCNDMYENGHCRGEHD